MVAFESTHRTEPGFEATVVCSTPGWDEDRGIRPKSGTEWKKVIDGLIAREWKTREATAQWARDRAVEPLRAYETELQDRVQLAARKVITDGVLDKAMNMNGRLRRDFIKMLGEYNELKGAA